MRTVGLVTLRKAAAAIGCSVEIEPAGESVTAYLTAPVGHRFPTGTHSKVSVVYDGDRFTLYRLVLRDIRDGERPEPCPADCDCREVIA